MINKVTLVGRIYRSELRSTKNGNSVLNARIGVKDKDHGGMTMVDLVFWAAVAEKAADLLDPEDRTQVIIEGALKQDKWVNEEGEPRTKLSVKVNQFFVLEDIYSVDSRESEELYE